MNALLKINDLTDHYAWRASLAEFIATFCFVFLGVGAVVSSGIFLGNEETVTAGRILVIALGHGVGIAIMVAATAQISGAHLNPAVTFSMVLTCKISVTKGAMYIVAQILGAVFAAFLMQAIIPDGLEGGLGSHALAENITVSAGLVMEMVMTFILVFVIFATAVDPRGPKHLAPFAIGMAVMVDIFVGLPLTGASMNPARTLGPAWAAGVWADHWVFWVGPLAGGSIAALLYQYVFARESTNHMEA